MRLRFQITGPRTHGLESELEDAIQVGHRFGRRVNRHSPPARRGETPQIVETHDVIGVGMGHDGGVDLPDIFTQTLSAKIGPRIDDISALWRFKINRSPGAVVARISRTA